MKVSFQWLSEYVDLSGCTASDLAEKLTRSGIEVDFIENRNKGVSNVVVGYVKSKENHPDADKLSVCKVDIGQKEELQIVCGAKNVDQGQKVAVAIIGAVLPGDFKIKKAKLRGVESQGMICSAKELGITDRLLSKEKQEGILVLPQHLKLGESVMDILALNDEVMELDLTPNRSDCLSMIGTAYEIAAILGREIKLPKMNRTLLGSDTKASERIHVHISAKEQCHHYAARYIEGVQVSPAPLWIQNRLMAAGIRPINNIVDITNLVLLEYGQPLHAFDADCLAGGRIEVRMAHKGEKIITLDQVERKLDESMLLITDGTKPVAIAGVMGAANSEVSSKTSKILLESAKFSGSSVRKTSRQLGLRSEASLRFEKEVNPEMIVEALDRAAILMAEYAGGRVAEEVVEDRSEQSKTISMKLTNKKVNDYLGTNISMEEIKSIFIRLNFRIEQINESAFQIEVPLRRGDITLEVDLIEEVARLYGYDRIPTTLMSGETTPGSLNKHQITRRMIRNKLTASGLHETINYSFTHLDKISSFSGLFPEAKPISLSMPMSEERAFLRTSLIPHLLDNALYNHNRNIDDVAIFEIGSLFITSESELTKLPDEDMVFSALITGKRSSTYWSDQADEVDFYDLKGILDSLLSFVGIEDVIYAPAKPAGYHPGRTAEVHIQSEEGLQSIGYIGQLHPSLQQNHDLNNTYIMEIKVSPIYHHASFHISYQALPRYPSITRDIAVVVNKAVTSGELVQSIKRTAKALLESIQVFDVFVGERLGPEKKSIALSLVYRHRDRTLTDEEVTSVHRQVVKELEVGFEAKLRK